MGDKWLTDNEWERLSAESRHKLQYEVGLLVIRAERAESELEKLREQNRWIPVSERLPETQKDVLIQVKSTVGILHIEKACYIPPKTVLSADFLCDEFADEAEEYDETNDCYWVVEGWWESSFEADTNWKISGEVLRWTYLPSAPQEEK
jgi:hypothetical protein